MKQTARLTVVLGTTCLIASIVLAVGNLLTEVPRQQAESRERQRNLRVVLPEFANDPLRDAVTLTTRTPGSSADTTVTFYPARDAEQGGRLIAFAAEATSSLGYGGAVTVLAGVQPDGTLMQVLVTGHSETPGLGTRVTDRTRTRYLWEAFSKDLPAGLAPSVYLDQFTGRAAAALAGPDFRLVKSAAEVTDSSVLAISGATVSSRAVADAVQQICSAFNQHRQTLTQP